MTETAVFATQQETTAGSVSLSYIYELIADRLTLYEQAIASLRESEIRLQQELTTLTLPAALQDALEKTTLKRATRHHDLPLTKEEAEAFNRRYNDKSIPAYFLNNNDRKVDVFVNEAAKKLVSNAQGQAGPIKLPLETLSHLLAIDHLPEQAGGRFPQNDFINQQHLLALLLKNALYNNPGTELIIGTNNATDTRPPYHKLTVDARHAFSPHTGEYVWTVCTVSGAKRGEALDQQTYDNARNGGKLVFPLPEDINNMVQERSAIVAQALEWIDKQRFLPQTQKLHRKTVDSKAYLDSKERRELLTPTREGLAGMVQNKVDTLIERFEEQLKAELSQTSDPVEAYRCYKRGQAAVDVAQDRLKALLGIDAPGATVSLQVATPTRVNQDGSEVSNSYVRATWRDKTRGTQVKNIRPATESDSQIIQSLKEPKESRAR